MMMTKQIAPPCFAKATQGQDSRATFALEEARKIARRFLGYLGDCTERIQIVGSIRRKKPAVKDIELLYIPKFELVKGEELFGDTWANLVDRRLDELIAKGELATRRNRNGAIAWGDKNKLGVHPQSGIPIDFFATTKDAWWNYLVCRTGGMESNIRICEAARAKGWKWNPYGSGFSRMAPNGDIEDLEHVQVVTEREVFEFAGLTYREPEER